MTKIIQFPGAKAQKQEEEKQAVVLEPALRLMDGTVASADQQKAIGIILSGATFICIGIKDAGGGADFFTACHGDEGSLRNAEDHLPAVIHRLFVRKGIVS